MLRAIVLVLTVLAMVGCSSKNHINIIELDTQGQWNPLVSAKAGGVLVGVEGSLKGLTVTYKCQGETDCLVKVNGDEVAVHE